MIKELQTFLAVAAAGSIQGATRSVPLTQPAITRQIQRLESLLNCQLLDRAVKPPQLTRAGEQAFSLGRTLLEQVAAFREGFGPAAAPTGLLRVGVAHAFLDWNGGRPVADAIERFMSAFTQVTVRLSAGWTPSLIAELDQGELDAAIVIARPDVSWPAPASATTLADDQLVAVAPPLFEITRAARFDKLFEYPWILNPGGCGYRSLLMSMAAHRGRTLHIAAEIHGAELHRRLVSAGLGVGFVPLGVARHWNSLNRSRTGLTIVKPKGNPFVIKAALVSNARSKMFSDPIEWLANRLRGALAGTR